jgi:Flp pilus assembly protein TadG
MKLRIGAVRRWLRRRGVSDRGSSAIELALLAPALLILTMVIIQFALWFQARQAALASAQDGARLGRTLAFKDQGTWQGLASAEAKKFYHGLGTNILTTCRGCGAGVNATAFMRTGPNGVPVVVVQVSGTLNSLLNMFGNIPVTVTVEGPEECFHPLDNAGACG